MRRNTELKIFNSILMNNWRGIVVDAPTLATAQAAFQNNIIAGEFNTTWVAPYAGVSLYGEDANSTNYILSGSNTQIGLGATAPGAIVANACSLLTNAWTFTNPDFRPNTAFSGSPVTTGTTAGPDLTAILEIDNALFTANQAQDFLADALENGTGATNGTITITIPKPSGWNITVPGITLTAVNQSGVNTTSNVSGGTPNTNANWNFRDDGANVIATSKPGVVIALGDFAQLGFTATRKGTTATGTNQNLGAFISGGGDTTPANNSAVTAFSAN
jgi:hypothetical protein